MPFFTTKVIINSSFGVTLTHPVMAVRVVIRTFTKWQERFGARKQSPPYLSYREKRTMYTVRQTPYSKCTTVTQI